MVSPTSAYLAKVNLNMCSMAVEVSSNNNFRLVGVGNYGDKVSGLQGGPVFLVRHGR